MLAWDYENGREIDDERGSNGFIRPSVEDAWVMAHAVADEQDTIATLRAALNRAQDDRNASEDFAAAVQRVAFDVVSSLGEDARKYAIEQSLCENYERYLSIAVGGTRETYVNSAREADGERWNYTRGTREFTEAHNAYKAQMFGQSLTEALVVNATRPREFVVTAPVTVTARMLSTNAPMDNYYGIGDQIERAVSEGRAHISESDTSSVECSEDGQPLSYSEAQQANENFHRRGAYTRSDY